MIVMCVLMLIITISNRIALEIIPSALNFNTIDIKIVSCIWRFDMSIQITSFAMNDLYIRSAACCSSASHKISFASEIQIRASYS